MCVRDKQGRGIDDVTKLRNVICFFRARRKLKKHVIANYTAYIKTKRIHVQNQDFQMSRQFLLIITVWNYSNSKIYLGKHKYARREEFNSRNTVLNGHRIIEIRQLHWRNTL